MTDFTPPAAKTRPASRPALPAPARHPARAPSRIFRAALALTGFGLLVGCSDGLDLDLRNNFGDGFDTSGAVRHASAPRPRPDNRGVISYPNYQVAVARRGDTLETVALRVGVNADELAEFNGVSAGTNLREGEIVALPGRVSEPSPATGADHTGPILPMEEIDVEALASNAINNADDPATPRSRPAENSRQQTGAEPVRHKVERGETAYSIARLYNVSVRALASWNGLGPDLVVREGQFLLIPVAPEARQGAATAAATVAATVAPGEGSPTPLPPSSSQALPENDTTTRQQAQASAPQGPDLGSERSDPDARLLMPVDGRIIRPFAEGRTGGIDIAASAGAAVVAADAGTVAAITQDTEEVPVLVLRHSDNILTIYANVTGITVEKGDRVSRGQTIARVNAGTPAFVRFEVRRGFDSVDPMEFLN